MTLFIGIDGDDTLWMNEDHFKKFELGICKLLSEAKKEVDFQKILLETERKNIKTHGYGKKSFLFSISEVMSTFHLPPLQMKQFEAMRTEFLQAKATPLPDVYSALEKLRLIGQLILITKGDKEEQSQKIAEAGVAKYFSSLEIVEEKNTDTYAMILDQKKISDVAHFVMIGNSMRSDILPVVTLGYPAIHIPYHLNWEFEKEVDHEILPQTYVQANHLMEAYEWIASRLEDQKQR